jgi:glycosyltransferase involved in cell wall biosynthesis
MIADMQRARMLAWDLPAVGWEVEVLAPDEELQRKGTVDQESDRFFNRAIKAHYVSPDEASVFKLFHVNGIGWRAFRPLFRKGLELVRTQHFDLIYISTAQFNLFCLGRLWQRKTGVPYVLDFHDPWVREKRKYVTTRNRLKARTNARLARFLERFAVSNANGIVSVSPQYLQQLRARYPSARSLRDTNAETIPFAALDIDADVKQTARTADPGRTIVYVGAGGSIMKQSFARIAMLFQEVRGRNPDFFRDIRIELLGTDSDWRPGQNKMLADLAVEFGLGEVVSEEPVTISYPTAMRKITAADGLLILGVDDPAYMPSKLFSYALTGKPLLVCLHQNSTANCYFDQLRGLGHLIHFGSSSDKNELEEMKSFLSEVKNHALLDRRKLLEPYLSPMAARRHAALFERCLGQV